MSLRGWGRSEPTPRPQTTPAAADDPRLPDLHPAQIDLIAEQQRITTAVTQIDDCLRRVGNGRPVMRDTLLDLRNALRPVATS